MIKNNLNDLTIFLIAFLYLFPILLTDKLSITLISTVLGIFNILIFRKINLKIFIVLLMTIVLPTISVFITSILYLKTDEVKNIIFLGIHTNQSTLYLSLYLMCRSFGLSLVSVMGVLAVQYDILVISLMQNLRLSVNIGYPLLATFNAFFHLKNEFIRIKQINKMRFGHNKNFLKMIFPLLVSTIRYAHQVGLTMETKNINSKKTFLMNAKFRKIDWIILLIEVFITVLISKIKIN